MIAATAIFVTYNVRDFARPDLVRHGQSVRTPLWVGPGRKRKSTQPGASGDANQKPRSHDTSRIVWAKLMARVGEKFPLECPACGGDIRLISLHQSRGRFGRFSPTSANRSNRLPSLPLAGRPPNGTNLSRCMTMAMSFRRHLTSCPRSTFTASESCPTRRDSAPTARKTPLQGGTRAIREPFSGPGQAREVGATGSPATHPSGNACGSAIDRAILVARPDDCFAERPAHSHEGVWHA